MSLSFKPTTEKEIAESMNIPPGIYPFEVMEAIASVSKKNNPMIEADLRLFMPDGKERGLTGVRQRHLKARGLCGQKGLRPDRHPEGQAEGRWLRRLLAGSVLCQGLRAPASAATWGDGSCRADEGRGQAGGRPRPVLT